MKRRFQFSFLAVFALCTTLALASHEALEPTDGTVNSFRWLKNPLSVGQVPINHWQGKRITLAEFEGKIVLFNIWASWCAPCVRELPALDRLQERFGGEDFVVVAVSIDSEPENARKMFVDRLDLKHLKFYIEPPEQLGKFFPVDVIPSNFFIDRNSRALGLLRSYVEWGDPSTDKLIKRLIEGADMSGT